MPTLVCYISGHGYGHASRTIEVLNTLVQQAPEVQVVIRSEASPRLVARTADPRIVLEPAICDTGAVQLDSLRLDPEATIRRAGAFMTDFDERVGHEAAALRRLGAAVVLADVPPLGVAAAHAAGVPAVVLGNFTWDWIYAAYPGGTAVAGQVARAYASADLALRLPLSGGFATLPRIEDIPFVARQSRRDPHDVRRLMGWPLDEPLVLVSFGGYGVNGLAVEALAHLRGCRVILPRGSGTVSSESVLIHLDEEKMYGHGLRYEDLVRSVDTVVSKPGYGIIAECVANGTALLYTSRGVFPEYDVLVGGLPGLLQHCYLPQDDLLAGRWQEALDALLSAPPPTRHARVDGARVAAARLIEFL